MLDDWCGQGGNGVPLGQNDWACMARDFNYAMFSMKAAHNLDWQNDNLARANNVLCDHVDNTAEGIKITMFFFVASGC